jgi:hypothetical protein
MAQRAVVTEANKRGLHADKMGKHGQHTARSSSFSPVLRVRRRPAKYSDHDLELLLEVIFAMFTETQSRKLRVAVPWDDTEEPETLVLADLATLIESWLD